MPSQKALVIIPTYNERDNILTLVAQILRLHPEINILVIDDTSPDGTADAVRGYMTSHARVHLMIRDKKEGLGRAYVAGFEWALARDYDFVVQMDADHSHRVVDLVKILDSFREEIHFVIGSRWIAGGAVKDWEWYRWLLSRAGNFYVNCVLKGNISDWTGGFNAWRAEVLRKIKIQTLEAQGYSFQTEMKYRALRLNFKQLEVPIVFEERQFGRSKMSFKIIFEAIIQVWRLKSKF